MSVLSTIARNEADVIVSCGYPCCKSIIVSQNKLNECQYRKEMAILKQKGLIKFSRWIEHDDELVFVQGWYLTDKGRESDEYQKACIEVDTRMKKIFGFCLYKDKEREVQK